MEQEEKKLDEGKGEVEKGCQGKERNVEHIRVGRGEKGKEGEREGNDREDLT